MNKNTMAAVVFSLLAMTTFAYVFWIVQTAMVHASPLIALCFGIVGTAGAGAIAACAWVIHNSQ